MLQCCKAVGLKNRVVGNAFVQLFQGFIADVWTTLYKYLYESDALVIRKSVPFMCSV